MDSKRNEYRKQLLFDITDLTNSIKADEEMLESIKDQGTTSYVLSQINKVEERNNNRLIEIDTLTKRKIELDKGNLDDELYKIIQQEKTDREDHNKAVIQKRLDNKERKEEKSKISKDFYSQNLKADRETRWSKKDMQRSYNYYLKNLDLIPPYIIRNLEEMPSNKGYIFRGVYCYGKLREEKNKPVTMFERQKGGLLIIHEWTDHEYKIYHKKDKDRKVFKSSEPRKIIKINLDSNILSKNTHI